MNINDLKSVIKQCLHELASEPIVPQPSSNPKVTLAKKKVAQARGEEAQAEENDFKKQAADVKKSSLNSQDPDQKKALKQTSADLTKQMVSARKKKELAKADYNQATK
jgi:hypothetical protein